MKRVQTILLCGCTLLYLSSYSQTALPKNLDEAIAYFEQNWTKQELTHFKNQPEQDAVIDLHFGTGLWIRNTWVRGNRDTALTNYFHTFGINDPDDISSVILTSLHRKLNHKSIRLVKLSANIQSTAKPIIACEQKMKATAVFNYNKFKTGDTVAIYMPVNDNKNIFTYMCPTISWTFNAKKDLFIKAEVVNKYFINDSSNVFFTVKINSLNRTDVKIHMADATIGDTINFSLYGLRVK